jgi:hypothetical protein
VTIYTEQISTRCGSGRIPRNAFYCPADQQIYWSNTLGDILAPFDESPRAGDQIMAHEFGHALQGRTGIIASSQGIRQNISDEQARLQLGRRTELQADCFAGQFMRRCRPRWGWSRLTSSGSSGTSSTPGRRAERRSELRRRPRARSVPPVWGSTGLGTDQVGRVQHLHRPVDQVR